MTQPGDTVWTALATQVYLRVEGTTPDHPTRHEVFEVQDRLQQFWFKRMDWVDSTSGLPIWAVLVQVTNPYYRTAYALVFKQGSGLEGVNAIGDGRLKGKRIGIVAGTPPATDMAVNGLMANAKPYPLVVGTWGQ